MTTTTGGHGEAVARALGGRRWGRSAWLAAWAVILVGQVYGASIGLVALQATPRNDVALVGALAIVFALQLVKAWVTLPRLADLGRSPDDVLWALTPVLNAALFFQLFERAPTESLRERRVRSWATQTSALQAWLRSASLLPRTATVGVPSALFVAALAGDGGKAFVDLVFSRAEGSRGDGLFEGLALAVGALGLYTLLQVARRTRVSRVSWLPSLFLLPLLFVALAVAYRDSTSSGAGPILLYLVGAAWEFGPVAVAGGVAAALWIASGSLALEGKPSGVGATWEAARGRLADVVVVWAGRYQLVQLGAEVIIPGIWFGVSFAFADWWASRPDGSGAFRASTARVAGVRGRVFKVLLVWFLLGQASLLSVLVGALGPEVATAALFDPSLVPAGVATAAFVGPWLATWWCALAMGVVFLERDALLAAREQAREASAAG